MERAKDAHRRRSQAQVPMAHVSLVFRRIHAMNGHDGICMYMLLHMILYDCIILHLRISKIIYCTCFCLEVENQSSVLVFSIYTSLLYGAAWVGQERSIAIAPPMDVHAVDAMPLCPEAGHPNFDALWVRKLIAE